MSNPNGTLENLKPFSSAYQPKNNGRKPSKLKKYIKDNNISIIDVRLMMKEVLSMDEDKLRDKLADKKVPMMIRLFVRVFLEDFKKGSLYNWEKMADRIYGKSTEHIDMQGEMNITQMTKEEREEKINALLAKSDFTANGQKDSAEPE